MKIIFKIHLILLFFIQITACVKGIYPNKDQRPFAVNEHNPEPVSESKTNRPNYLDLAKRLVDQGYFEVALANLKNVLNKHHGDPEVYFLMGHCERKMGRYKLAEKHFYKAISLKKDYAPAYNGLGLLYDYKKKFQQAHKFYQKAISINPARADFYNNLGFSLLLSKEPEKAKICFLKAISLAPSFQRAFNNLALCYTALGQDQKALNILKKIYPASIAHYNMGVIYELLDKKDNAIEMYKIALKFSPNFKKAKKNLISLKNKE